MNRTKLSDRILPTYTKGEETFNMVSHIVGAGLGVVALVLCVVFPAIKGDVWGVVSGAIYGSGLVLLYTMSSIYHGLVPGTPKKVLQVLDHCTIYFLIGASYTPVALCALRPTYPGWGWTLFGIVWGLAIIATVFTAIDLKKYSKLSMACYVGMGWSIVLVTKPALECIPTPSMLWLFAGGIAYSIGAIIYGLGKKRRNFHSIFHVFVVAGSVLQFVSIFFYIL